MGFLSSGFVPGQATPLTVAREWASVPKALMLAALAMGVREYLKPPSKVVVNAKACQSKYCKSEIWVDRPINTLNKDQSMGVGLSRPSQMPWVGAVGKQVKSDFAREQLMSPGVQLVARSVANRVAAPA